MSLRESKVFRAVGYSCFALAIAGFALHVLHKVLTGNAHETYRSGTLIQWTYGGALIVLIIMALLGIYWVGAKAYRKWLQ